MGVITFRLEGKEAGGVRAFLRLTEAQRKAELQALKVGKAGKKGKQDLAAMARAGHGVKGGLDGAAVSAVRFVAAFAGVGTIVTLFHSWTGHLEKVRNLLMQLGNEATGSQEKVLKLADQLGDTSERGLMKAVAMAADVSRAGALPSLAEGAMIAQSVLSNIDAPRRQQLAIARSIARLGGKAGVTAQEAGVLPQLIQAAGAKGDPGQFMAELDAALKASPGLGLGAFGVGTIKGTLGLLGLGMPRTEALARMAQARQAASTEEEAAGYLRRIAQTMVREPVRELIAGAAGKPYEELAWPERFETMGDLVGRMGTDPRVRRQIEGVLEAREQMLFPAFFGAGARETYQRALGAVQGAKPETFQAQAAAFAESKLGIKRRLDVARDLRRGTMDVRQFAELELDRVAGEIAQETPALFGEEWMQGGAEMRRRKIRENLRGGLGLGPAVEMETPEMVRQRYKQARRLAIQEYHQPRAHGEPGPIEPRDPDPADFYPGSVNPFVPFSDDVPPATQPAPVIHNHGDQFFLGERGDLTRPGADAPGQGEM